MFHFIACPISRVLKLAARLYFQVVPCWVQWILTTSEVIKRGNLQSCCIRFGVTEDPRRISHVRSNAFCLVSLQSEGLFSPEKSVDLPFQHKLKGCNIPVCEHSDSFKSYWISLKELLVTSLEHKDLREGQFRVRVTVNFSIVFTQMATS